MTNRFNFADVPSSDPGVTPKGSSRGESQGRDSLQMLRGIIGHARLAGIIIGSVMIVSALVLFLIPNQYTSVTTILPSGQPDQIQELKSLAGLGDLTSSNDNPSDLFPTILRSRVIGDAVINKSYTFADGDRTMTTTLKDYLDEDTPDKLAMALAEMSYVSTDRKTGVITLAVETKYPAFSQQIAQAYLKELDGFNLYKRRSQAKENASYLNTQLEQTKADLDKAETELQDFQSVNRNWAEASDPELQMTVGRMQRTLEIQNKKFLYLTQEYEMAKLDVQKDVPIVSVLDQPTFPTEKSSPHRLAYLIMIMAVVSVLTLLTIVGYELFRTRIGQQERALLREATSELRQSLRLKRKAETAVVEQSVAD